MKLRAILALGVVVAAASGHIANANPLPRLADHGFSPRLVLKASCDINGDDKQARCMESCDEAWIKDSQAYNRNIEKAKAEKKACEVKCGC